MFYYNIFLFYLYREEFRKKIDAGILINDSDVVYSLLEELLNKKYENGVIVDGFPRTVIQAHCIKLLYERMRVLRKNNENNKELLNIYHRPKFHIVVLYIDEKESIKRQLYRGDIVYIYINYYLLMFFIIILLGKDS